MSVWNAVLQACHSALIDELNAEFPDDKLELDLPKRLTTWAATPETDTYFIETITTPEGAGSILLACRKESESSVPRLEKTFRRLLILARREFLLREISAQIVENSGNFRMSSPPPLRMLIWLPIRILGQNPPLIYDLGIGV
ncbi:MAG: hypothetical protein H7301_05565 [Cryobacterium sp.]|nr:hypothetical protein [Oligoflexia bacterium]